MVILVAVSPIFPSKNNFVKALRKEHPEISTVVLNVNDKFTSMILGEKEQVLYGKGYIEDKLCGKTFRISPKSFYQVNPQQTEKLYQIAIDSAGLTGKERVLDAYCGTGTIGIIASQKAGEVIGVELNKDAVRDAVNNARANGRNNIRFYQDDASHFLKSCAADGVRADGSLFTVDDPTVVIETVKLAEDRSGDLIVRLYESMNGTRRATFKTALKAAQVWRCNMLEEAEDELEMKDGAVQFDVKPFEIVTLRLKKA